MKEFIVKYQLYIRIIIPVLLIGIIMFGIKGKFVRQSGADYNDRTDVSYYYELNSAKQYFTLEQALKSIDVIVRNESEELEDIQLKLSLYHGKDDSLIGEVISDIYNFPVEAVIHFELDDPVPFHPDKKNKQEIYFQLETIAGSNVTLPATEGEYQEKLMINDDTTNYRSRFLLGFEDKAHPYMLIVIAILLFVILELLFLHTDKIFCQKLKTQHIFLIISLTAGIGFAVVNPASQECDGWEHYLRSVDVSYGNLLSPVLNIRHGKGVINVPKNINSFNFKLIAPNSKEGNIYVENLQNMRFSKDMIEMKYESMFVSLFYYPQGLGLFIGRTLNLSMYVSVIIARILNLIVYCVLTYLAIKFIPFCKNLLMVVALLPLSIAQSASCSPDALLHGLSFLFIAICLNFAYEKEKKRTLWHGLLLGLLLGLLFLCKYIYLSMGLLVFLIPMKVFGEKKDYFKAFLFALIPLVVIIPIMMPHFFGSVGQMSFSSSEGMTQMDFIQANPMSFIKILVRTFIDQFDSYVEYLNTLGWLNYPIEPLISIIPCFLTVIGVIDTNQRTSELKTAHRVLLFVTFSFCVFLMMMGLYISDGRLNPVGNHMISGVQGRYFLPVLIIPFITFSSKNIKNTIKAFSLKTGMIMGVCLLYTQWVLIGYCY